MRESSAYFLVGSTATGKSAIGQHIAEAKGHDIVSADSMLVYRGMDIGTAKPEANARARVSYFGLDVADPDQSFHVEAWLCAVTAAFSKQKKGQAVIVTGGTGLYLRCLVEGLDRGAAPDPGQRAYWESILKESGVSALQETLKKQDPDRYASLADKQNARRLIRALESVGETGPQSTGAWSGTPQHVPFVGLQLDPGLLNSRIESRVREMYRRGLVEEAGRLVAQYPQWSATASQAIGYAEALRHMVGEISLEAAVERTVIRTRQLAKRQRTWFRHQARVAWVEVEENMELEDIASAVTRLWHEHGPTGIMVNG